ncbi:MAG: TIGR03936 family radical SAM-associated protein, partial [Clostridia bacterium]|nr:TIGR03936 family radical SAM-associated protein [Clostridia bacterium]
MTKYRLKYCKESGMRFISHLDLLKLFSRAARRCRLPLSYSQGFNPHPELVFNAPLPLGVTSEAEYVDLSLDEDLTEEECLKRLSSVLPEGIRPLTVRKLAEREATVMKYVCACQYRLTISVQGITPASFVSGIRERLALEEPIMIMKKSKSGVKETDIRPLIRTFFEDLVIEN